MIYTSLIFSFSIYGVALRYEGLIDDFFWGTTNQSKEGGLSVGKGVEPSLRSIYLTTSFSIIFSTIFYISTITGTS